MSLVILQEPSSCRSHTVRYLAGVDDVGPGAGLGRQRPRIGTALDRIVGGDDDVFGCQRTNNPDRG